MIKYLVMVMLLGCLSLVGCSHTFEGLVLLQPNNYGFSQLVGVPGKARLAGKGHSLGKRRNAVQGC